MRFHNEGMSLWDGTPDAPAPSGVVQADTEATVTVGVQPIDASNRVDVLYRINWGLIETVAAKWLRNDPFSGAQYFRASLPHLRAGDMVEYTAICHCAGRQVPSPEEAKRFASSFRVNGAEAGPTAVLASTKASSQKLDILTSSVERPIAAFSTVSQPMGRVFVRTESLPQDDDIPYRDYLLVIFNSFVTAIQNPRSEFETEDQFRQRTRQQTLRSLREKFKQDFATTDSTLIGANRVPLEVVTAALVEDLGIAASAIRPQGSNVPDRQYLDTLIALANRTQQELSSAYRINLSRSDLEQTTRVHQNILTLQSHFRDGNVIDNRSPFFLYKDEWRLRFATPFFPENYYLFKTGLFSSQAVRNSADTLVRTVKGRQEFQQDTSSFRDFVARLDTLLGVDGGDEGVDRHLIEGHRQFLAEEYGVAKDHYVQAEEGIRALVRQMRIFLRGPFGEGAITILLDDAPVAIRVLPGLAGKGGAELFRTSLDPNMQLFAQDKPAVTQHGNPFDIPNGVVPADGDFPFTSLLLTKLSERYDNRRTATVDSPSSLAALEARNVVTSIELPASLASYQALQDSVKKLHDDLVSLVPHVMFLLLPLCQGDVAAAAGDFVTAAHRYAQVMREHLLRASLTTDFPAPLPADGDLPWSWTGSTDFWQTDGRDYPYLTQNCEVPLLKLRLGALYLAWADQLYRSDQEPEVFRARELYKAVLRQYGVTPQLSAVIAPLPSQRVLAAPAASRTSGIMAAPALIEGISVRHPPENTLAAATSISPTQVERTPTSLAAWFPVVASGVSLSILGQPIAIVPPGGLNGGAGIPPSFPMPVNPAILAQETRAQLGLTQIDAGLNYFGYSDDLVPILRYRTLALAAQCLAKLAKQAESDYLSFKEHAENAELGMIQARSAVAIAALRVQIESQRILEAEDFVIQATIQVQQVRDAIDAKQKEIDDHNSLCGEVNDFFGGIFDFFKQTPDFAADYMKSDFKVAFGLETHEAGAAAGLGVVGGFALFGIASGVTLSGMADKANDRGKDLTRLQTQQLPMALAALDARTRELTIAQLQKGVAALEASLAQEILRYSALRTLNAEVWGQLAAAIRRVLRRYLDLGALTGWLAERALSYDQDRDIRLIRFDYFSLGTRGLLAADLLQSDLATLEEEYLVGFRQMLPIKWTISLARDFPLEFGQLKTSGRCTFMTSAAPLDLAYPGSFAHRVRSVEVGALVPVTEQIPRGLLRNAGVSRVEDEEVGEGHMLVRPPDVYPLSEFTLKDDMAIYGLPGESLMPFEGSGIDTLWELEMPPAANPGSLAALADISVTFRLNSRFSVARRNELAAIIPTISRSVLFAAKQSFSSQFQAFVSGQASITFGVTPDLLPSAETNRQVRNVAVFFLGNNLPVIKGTLASTVQPAGARFITDGGLAHSNRVPEPAASSVQPPPSTLDPITVGIPDQNWILTVPNADNSTLDRSAIREIIFGIEYTAQPVPR